MKIPILSKWLERRSTTLQNPSQWLVDFFGGTPSATGKAVNPSTAIQNTAVYACVRVLAETVASLPLFFYERTEEGKRKATKHPLYHLLHTQPNPEMTSFTFRETLMGHLTLWGNAYAEIERNGAGRPIALWPLRPERVQVMRKNGEIVYYITDLDIYLSADRVLHIPGFGFDGLVGKSPISLAREAVGLALATEEYGARFFGNGAKPGGVLEHPGTLSPEAQERLRNSWNEMHQGLTKQHRIAILEEGMTYKQIGLPPEDSQFLQTRKFQLNEIARIFRVPPHLIGDLERSTNNNIEHQSIEFVVHTIRPWLVRWEQAINTKLLMESEKEKYHAEFVVDGLLRGDIQSRYSAYATARQWGWMSVNDIRELENMNRIENGDIYLQPMNMVEAGYTPEIEPDPPELPEERQNTKEQRALRSASNRFKLTQQYEKNFERAAQKIVIKEIKGIKEKVQEFLTERSNQAFTAWLEKYYREQIPAEIRKTLLPSFRNFAVLIYQEAAKEVNFNGDFSQDLEQFLLKYIDGFIRRYADSSKGQLLALLDGEVEDIEERLDEWSEKKAGKVAMNETTRIAGAVSKLAYIAAGVTVIKWINTSGRPCPYCETMHGKTISINGTFVQGGTEYTPNGASPLRISTNIGHPPLHQGCQCQIVAE